MQPLAAAPLVTEDDPAWGVHADALLEAGTPRGLLVAWQRGPPMLHDALPDEQRQLITVHGLLGPVTQPAAHRLSWQRGYWYHLGSDARRRPDEFWDATFAHDSARYLRELSLRWVSAEALLRGLRVHQPPLARLHWHEREAPVALDELFELTPALRTLELWRPGHFHRGPGPALRRLSVNTGDGGDCVAADLLRHARAGGLAALRELEVWGAGALPWVPLLLEACRPTALSLCGAPGGRVVHNLVRSSAFRTLDALAFRGFWPDDAQLEELVTALEARGAPLRSFTSTGLLPAPRLLARLRAVTQTCDVTG